MLVARRHYQPVYTSINPIGEVLQEGQRKCIDRADMIFRDLSTLGITDGSLLDIGCNIGFFCHYFQSRGYSCTGYEDDSHGMRIADKKSIEAAEELSGHYDVYPKFIAASALSVIESEAKFDVILCLSVAHHWFGEYGHSAIDGMRHYDVERVLRSFYDMSKEVVYFEFGDIGGWSRNDISGHLRRITSAEPVKIGISIGYEGVRDVWRFVRI